MTTPDPSPAEVLEAAWITHDGGQNPCPVLEVRLRDGSTMRGGTVFWPHLGGPSDVVAYRWISRTAAQTAISQEPSA